MTQRCEETFEVLKAAYKPGMTVADLAKATYYHCATVYEYKNALEATGIQLGKTWAQIREKILKIYHDGMTAAEIARRVGCHKVTLYNHREELNSLGVKWGRPGRCHQQKNT